MFEKYDVEVTVRVPMNLLPEDLKDLDISLTSKISGARRERLERLPLVGPLVRQLDQDVDHLREVIGKGDRSQ